MSVLSVGVSVCLSYIVMSFCVLKICDLSVNKPFWHKICFSYGDRLKNKRVGALTIKIITINKFYNHGKNYWY